MVWNKKLNKRFQLCTIITKWRIFEQNFSKFEITRLADEIIPILSSVCESEMAVALVPVEKCIFLSSVNCMSAFLVFLLYFTFTNVTFTLEMLRFVKTIYSASFDLRFVTFSLEMLWFVKPICSATFDWGSGSLFSYHLSLVEVLTEMSFHIPFCLSIECLVDPRRVLNWLFPTPNRVSSVFAATKLWFT